MPLEARATHESPDRKPPGRTVEPMNDQTRTAHLQPQTERAQGGVGAPHLDPNGPDADRPDTPNVIERMTPQNDLPSGGDGRAPDRADEQKPVDREDDR